MYWSRFLLVIVLLQLGILDFINVSWAATTGRSFLSESTRYESSRRIDEDKLDRLKRINYGSFNNQIRHEKIPSLKCCEYLRPSEYGWITAMREATEKFLLSSFFDAPIQKKKIRFVVPTTDSITLDILKSNKGIPPDQRLDEIDWRSLDSIEKSLRKFANEVGEGAVVVVMAHHDGEELHIDLEVGTFKYSIDQLRQVATKAGVELLPWGCETGKTQSGGIKQPYRLRPLLKAINTAYKQQDVTWGGFLNEINETLGITFIFDAMKVVDSGLLYAETKSENEINKIKVYFPSSVVPSSATINRDIFTGGFIQFFLRLEEVLANMIKVSIMIGITVGVGVFLGTIPELFNFTKPILRRLLSVIGRTFLGAFFGTISFSGVVVVLAITIFTLFNLADSFLEFDFGRLGAAIFTLVFMLWLFLKRRMLNSMVDKYDKLRNHLLDRLG